MENDAGGVKKADKGSAQAENRVLYLSYVNTYDMPCYAACYAVHCKDYHTPVQVAGFKRFAYEAALSLLDGLICFAEYPYRLQKVEEKRLLRTDKGAIFHQEPKLEEDARKLPYRHHIATYETFDKGNYWTSRKGLFVLYGQLDAEKYQQMKRFRPFLLLKGYHPERIKRAVSKYGGQKVTIEAYPYDIAIWQQSEKAYMLLYVNAMRMPVAKVKYLLELCAEKAEYELLYCL